MHASKISLNSSPLLPALALIGLPLVLSACFLFEGNRETRKTPKIIIRDSLIMDRLASGESARLAFKTEVAALCEIRVSTQDGTKDKAVSTTPCQGSGQTNFVEPVAGLKIGTLYVFEIAAWSLTGSRANADRVSVNESEGQQLGKDLIVVRLNKPLATAEAHRFVDSANLDLNTMKEKLRLPLGCQKGIAAASSPFAAAVNSKITELSSSGYANGAAVPHPGFPERLRLQYNLFLNESRWQWRLKDGNSEHEFLGLQGAEIYNVEISSALQTRKLGKPDLRRPENILQIDPGHALVARWSADNLAETSFVTMQVGSPEQEGAFFCSFAAEKQTGSVDKASEFLNGLKRGISYDVVISLYAAQLQLFPSSEKAPWLLASYDWRSAVIQRI